MSSKNSRCQSVINLQSNETHSEDHWLKEFENKLQKTSVQPAKNSVYDEIISVMQGSKSKYPSVQAAVDDMMQRSGLVNYLDTIKEAKTKQVQPTITVKNTKVANKKAKLFQEVPTAYTTLNNIITDSKGNLPISAIINRLHALHARDTSNETVWDDEELVRLVSQLNLEAKKNNPQVFERFNNLGKLDHSAQNSDSDPSNTDAFHILMPAKV